MSNQQKEKKDLDVLSARVFVLITEEDKKRADDFLLKQKLEQEERKMERKSRFLITMKDLDVLSARVFVLITEEDKKRADEFVLKQNLEQEETEIETKRHFLNTTKQVSSEKLRKKKTVIFVCDYCQKQFSCSSHLKRHVKIHTGQKDFHCNLCNYSCYQKENLQDHIRSHLKERPFKCQEPNCGASFTQSAHSKRHQLVHNKKDKRFSCSACPFKTHARIYLTRHMKNIHSESRSFKCPHENCEFSAKQKGNLKKHLKIHSEEKNQVCPHPNCGFKTKFLSNLKRHMELHSNEEKTYKCYFCNFSTRQQNNLVVHIRLHTGETPFSCQLCPYKSKQKTNLDSHMKTHSRFRGK